MNTPASSTEIAIQPTHRIASHRIESHHIASYRIATTPGAIAESLPPFFSAVVKCLHIRLLEGENPSNSVSLFVWSPVSSPVRGHRRLGAFSKSTYCTVAVISFGFEISAFSDSRLLQNTHTLPTDRRSFGSQQLICTRNEIKIPTCLANGRRTRCADACIACLWFAFDSHRDERKSLAQLTHAIVSHACRGL